MNPTPWFGAWTAIVRRELVAANRARADALNPVLFFVLVSSLFPLALSPTEALLRTIGPGVLWVCALLATLLSLERLFRADFDDGTLDQLLISPFPTPILVLGKVFAHWLVAGLPLVIVAPVIGIMYGLPGSSLGISAVALALGTPTLSLIGSIGVALTVGLPRGGVLLSLVVLPLYVPILIFGAQAVEVATRGLPATGHLYWLGAFFALALTLCPLAAAAALRISAR
ncbi:MAG: heme exporter protein CcmB [Pseudomonadota bacterium]